MLSSGMCTEVFQFDISPTTIVPVYSSAMPNASHNSTENLPSSQSHKVKNRRILHSMAIPLKGSTSNHSDHLKAHPKNESFAGNKPASSVVVSVLADPRVDADGRISSKSLSRIFVVVLVDSVKYVTYSCVLPFKTHSPHLWAGFSPEQCVFRLYYRLTGLEFSQRNWCSVYVNRVAVTINSNNQLTVYYYHIWAFICLSISVISFSKLG